MIRDVERLMDNGLARHSGLVSGHFDVMSRLVTTVPTLADTRNANSLHNSKNVLHWAIRVRLEKL